MLSPLVLIEVSAFVAAVMATVFGVAGIGKLWSRPRPRDAAVALVELLLAVLLLIDPSFRELALIASVALAGSYVGHSFFTRERCHCFGKALPSTGVRAQRARNVVIFLVAVIGAFAAVIAQAKAPSFPVFDFAGGLATGIFVVTLPWILDIADSDFGPKPSG